MSPDQTKPSTIDEYIAGYPADVRAILEQVRAVIRAAAPDAQETIKYEIPTFTLQGNLVSFAGYKKHIGVYPVPAGTEAFLAALAPYRAQKSTVRFPLDKPLPYDLIGQLVKFRVHEHLASVASRAKKEAK